MNLADNGVNQYNCLPRKKSQIVSIGSESRVYTPDQLNQMYDESIWKFKGINVNNSMLYKSKKIKRGVKTSYGNYTQCEVPNQVRFKQWKHNIIDKLKK